MADSDHARWMRHCLAMARRPPFALYCAAIVDRETGELLADGRNDVEGDSPLIHGETDAIAKLAGAYPGYDGRRLVLYTTGEPCPMCQAAIGWAGIATVVYGASTPFLRAQGFWTFELRAAEVAAAMRFPDAAWPRCEVIAGVLEAECEALFRDWLAAHPEEFERR